jgi:hypothetical protein
MYKVRVKMHESINVNVWRKVIEVDGYRVAFCRHDTFCDTSEVIGRHGTLRLLTVEQSILFDPEVGLQ